jgi:hypothetical protein
MLPITMIFLLDFGFYFTKVVKITQIFKHNNLRTSVLFMQHIIRLQERIQDFKLGGGHT